MRRTHMHRSGTRSTRRRHQELTRTGARNALTCTGAARGQQEEGTRIDKFDQTGAEEEGTKSTRRRHQDREIRSNRSKRRRRGQQEEGTRIEKFDQTGA
ncbi:hypothetical protein AMTR_s00057p00217380 [Amborella trichopoda]|uniref:Uncharacterized protein n=1 Tax=Amborella trichopoda TaxID=13333 RepID=U5D6H9_AMBTC|nr:hypothetical protein AMTR_s00057p00217380 [Amborella trichopoda]